KFFHQILNFRSSFPEEKALTTIACLGLVWLFLAVNVVFALLRDNVAMLTNDFGETRSLLTKLVIGLFLSAMGVGSYLSKFFKTDLLASLIGIEIGVGLIGGCAALAGFTAFALTELYTPILLTLVAAIGILVGLEIPLMIRILRELESLRVTLANVLSADYLGALVASVLFPFALLPHLGLVRAGFVVGLTNVAVAGLFLWRFAPAVGHRAGRLKALTVAAGLLLGVGAVGSTRLTPYLENRLYQDEIVLAQDTRYQRLVLTRWRDDVRLYLNGHLQFSSIDEYRYHEALIHPALSAAARRAGVLILGGGDGLAVREVAKYSDVRRIDLVDIDPAVTNLFKTRPMLTALNGGALSDQRVHIHNVDAMRFMEDSSELYDVIVMDLPDPSAPGLGKLYSRAFFNLAGRRLAADGVLVSQCTSPFRSREAFWCIVHTLAAARCGSAPEQDFEVRPYHTIVPTFGTWGFAIAGAALPDVNELTLRVPTRYLSEELLPGLFVFPPDMAEVETPVSRLDDPVVCRLYQRGYHKYLE
ncbi:MAG: polyamine aminopropyltransferase, partial [Planctomycetes bacterium]|nr:polyamine aminopropyltransferase [Planctomycetota bacterium]